VSDRESREEQSGDGGGGALRLLRSLAIGAAVAGAVVGGRKLLERRREAASAKERTGDGDGQPADLETELRGAAGELALTLLDRATDRLERTNERDRSRAVER